MLLDFINGTDSKVFQDMVMYVNAQTSSGLERTQASRPTISEISQTWSLTPAAIAGVTRSVW